MTKIARRNLFGLGEPELSPREKIRLRYFPNIELVTHEGRKVRFYEDLIKDKVVMINMMFTTCPGVCPGIMANLLKVQKLLGDRVGKEIFMYSLSLDPARDTPRVLGEYARKRRLGPGWTLLTGKVEDMEVLRRKLGFTNPNPLLDKDIEQHIGNVRYGNEPLMLWAASPGLADAQWLVESLSFVIRPERHRPESRSVSRAGDRSGL